MILAIENTTQRSPFLKNRYARIGLGVLPASLITAGLFFGMQAMIHVDNYQHPPKAVRTLTAYVVGPKIDQPIRPDRTRPKRPVDIKTPPPEPKYAATVVPVNFEAVTIGAAPIERNIVSEVFVPIANVLIIDDTDTRPISPPVIVYPIKAAERGIEGTCEVRMDVSPRGEPFNIRPNCSHSVFEAEAKRAISRVQFKPKTIRGTATERRNVIYPLEFKLS